MNTPYHWVKISKSKCICLETGSMIIGTFGMGSAGYSTITIMPMVGPQEQLLWTEKREVAEQVFDGICDQLCTNTLRALDWYKEEIEKELKDVKY